MDSGAQLFKDGGSAQLDEFDSGDNVVIRFRSEAGESKAISVRDELTPGSSESAGTSGNSTRSDR
jgi:hypothetical protein